MNYSISCDDCSLQCTSACDDCVVTFVLRTETELEREPHTGTLFDLDDQRVLRLFSNAGLVPSLRYEAEGSQSA